MKIYAIRHGLTELNKKQLINGHLEDELAPEGIEQAKSAAKSLPKSIKRIYSSSLNRAKQTAAILNEELKVPLTFHDELKEVGFGILDGTPFSDEIKKIHMSQKYDWGPSGESTEDVKKRSLKILKQIKKENGDGEALVVVHGGIVRMLYLLQDGTPVGEIDNASLHAFDLDKILK
jgi:broad specificity phosphatase PhoE